MREELELEEIELLAQIERQEREQEQDDLAAIAQFEAAQASPAQLPCPVCKEQLRELRRSTYCDCGLFLENVTLTTLRQQLAEITQIHSASCAHAPFFCMELRFGMNGLYMLCNHCDAFEVVA